MNLGLLRSISALDQQPLPEPIGQIRFRWRRIRAIHQPGHQLMGHQVEVNVPLGMPGKTKLARQDLQGCSNPVPGDLVGVSDRPGHGSSALQLTATQDLQRCGKVPLTTDATAVGSEQNQLGSI